MVRPAVVMMLSLALVPALQGCSRPKTARENPPLLFPGEKHFKSVRQLTRGGTNAEAYWSFDGNHLIFQRKGSRLTQDRTEPAAGVACDQIYTMDSSGREFQFISKNQGRTTCPYYLPGNERVLFASTRSAGPECPPNPDMSKGYVWPIYPTYQLYTSKLDGSDIHPVEPGAPNAYNAEATVCQDGSVIFTSDRHGDLELYTGKLDPAFSTISRIRRITREIGYDGGAFFSQDCTQIVWRASRPRPGKERDDYLSLLKEHLVRPGTLEIWTAKADGSEPRQVTRLNSASFAPFFTPDAKQILFSSNLRNPRGRNFDLYRINVDGTGLERVTYSNSFDSFPMFSPDGKYLAFSSNRNAAQPQETNVFVAEWEEIDRKGPTLEGKNPANRFKVAVDQLRAKPHKARTWLYQQFLNLGLKKLELAAHSVVGRFGKDCGRSNNTLIAAPLNSSAGGTPAYDPSGLAILLETVRMVQAAQKKGCTVFAAVEQPVADTLPKLGARTQAALVITSAASLENNTISLTATGLAAHPKLQTWVPAECAERMLHCNLKDKSEPKPPRFPLLQISAGPQKALNATGALQIAEFVTALTVDIAHGKRNVIESGGEAGLTQKIGQ